MANRRRQTNNNVLDTIVGLFIISILLSLAFYKSGDGLNRTIQRSFVIFIIIITLMVVIYHFLNRSVLVPIDIEQELNQIDGMEGHDFEYYCADLLKYVGFTNINVTRGSGDQGADIVAYRRGAKYVIQCKRYSSRLTNKPVQEVNGAKGVYQCRNAIVITNNYFTNGAVELARANNVELWDRNKLIAMLKEKQDYIAKRTKKFQKATIEQSETDDDGIDEDDYEDFDEYEDDYEEYKYDDEDEKEEDPLLEKLLILSTFEDFDDE